MKAIRFFLAVVAGLMIVNDNPAAQDFRINFWGMVLAKGYKKGATHSKPPQS